MIYCFNYKERSLTDLTGIQKKREEKKRVIWHAFDVVCTNVTIKQLWKLEVNLNYVESDPTIN